MVVCAKCRSEPRRPGQRWGAACFRAYMRDYMKRYRALGPIKTQTA